MKCFVCGSETPGEVCNQCLRTERNLFHKEWDYKEGFLVKKVESYRVDVSSYRISGIGMISNSDKGLVARLDAFNHFIGNVESVERKPYNGKDAVMVHYKNPNTQQERFIFFVNFNAEEGLRNAVQEAKKDLETDAMMASMGRFSGEMAQPVEVTRKVETSAARTTPAPAETAAAAVMMAKALQTPSQAETAPTGAVAGVAPNPEKGAILPDMEIRLKKLQVLLNNGILTQEEYEKEKSRMGF